MYPWPLATSFNYYFLVLKTRLPAGFFFALYANQNTR